MLSLLIAAALAISTFLATTGRLHTSTRLVAVWDAFAASNLLLSWITLLRATVAQIRRTALKQDLGGTLISSVIILAAAISMLAVGLLLGPTRGVPEEEILGHVVLSAIAIIGSWSLTHTVFALHYAHLYYQSPEKRKGASTAGGLAFPCQPQPDYVDFAYFAFVIGMTCQVSDVQVLSRRMRRLTLLHGVLSFGFNTLILALTVNVVAQML
jgi:uncharacterized membrane protein